MYTYCYDPSDCLEEISKHKPVQQLRDKRCGESHVLNVVRAIYNIDEGGTEGGAKSKKLT